MPAIKPPRQCRPPSNDPSKYPRRTTEQNNRFRYRCQSRPLLFISPARIPIASPSRIFGMQAVEPHVRWLGGVWRDTLPRHYKVSDCVCQRTCLPAKHPSSPVCFTAHYFALLKVLSLLRLDFGLSSTSARLCTSPRLLPTPLQWHRFRMNVPFWHGVAPSLRTVLAYPAADHGGTASSKTLSSRVACSPLTCAAAIMARARIAPASWIKGNCSRLIQPYKRYL
ncbi:hypothetical protein K469DRAFT_325862 [Zopfia rhizophila CBS 207.26]|uniref:Uncharacterized protein n=1 Tax=Zopfia rhizophila CBS 207.26 TaxID=1314779 RepID=A0A6A6DHB4_9PEZI|nr:hypothetical protein K469DRAFT_325862 [Zopfia rhizophila CBS 207.26]